MINDMRQFVPSNVCLSCEGCCRFKEEDSAWRPRITHHERKQIPTKPALAEKIFSKATVDDNGHLRAVACHGLFICSFFNPEHNSCGIYHARPFDCQLYPFLLTKENEKIILSVHLNCPYVQEKKGSEEFEFYIEYLQKFFLRPEIVTFINKNPSLVGDYSQYRDELEEIFELDLR